MLIRGHSMPNEPNTPANEIADETGPANEITTKKGPVARRIPVLPVRDTVLFPHAVLPLTVGRESSIQLIESLGEERTIVVAAQIRPSLPTCTPLAHWPPCTRWCACPTRAALSLPKGWNVCGCCATSRPSPSCW